MKTKEELNALKEEVEAESKQRCELTEEEAAQVRGGGVGIVCNRECIDPWCSNYLVQVFTNRTTCHICGGPIRPV